MHNPAVDQIDELIGQIQDIENFELHGFVERLEGLSAVVRVNSQKVHIGIQCWLHPLPSHTWRGHKLQSTWLIGLGGKSATILLVLLL